MCGIAGVLNFSGMDTETVERMNNIAKYRGPDDEGYTFIGVNNIVQAFGNDSINEIKKNTSYSNINNYTSNDFYLAFAHRRLSIIDLSEKGHQPMFDAEKKIHLTFNGEIYNYIEIRDELESLGHIFKSQSDSEVIIRAYIQWGEDCVKHFNGMWAFAIYDELKKKLFCSRDRLGAKPFHYYYDGKVFIFGSEIKQIIQDKNINREVDEETLALSIYYGISDFNEKTLIKNICVLKGGQSISVMINPKKRVIESFKIYNYWDLNINNDYIQSLEYEKIIGKELNRSIKYRLRSDVEIGVLLSGGLDSSSLTALAADMHNKTINTFTSCYNVKSIDESHYAHMVNEYSKTNENFVFPKIKNIENEFEKIIWFCEGLSGFALLGANYVIKAAAEKGIKVILNGQGGDETLLGYERYYAYFLMEMLKKGRISEALKDVNLICHNSKLSRKQLLLFCVYFNFPLIRKAIKRKEVGKFVTEEIIKKVSNKKTMELFKAKNLQDMEYNEIRKTQLTHILRWDDRLYMSNSVESRVPFIDYEFLEKAFRIPPKEKIGQGYTKYLLREFMDGKMPNEVTWRKNKLGFEAPVDQWASEYSLDYINDITTKPRSKKYFNIDEIRNLFIKDPSNNIIQTFLSIEIFMRLFDVKASEE